MSTNSTPYPQSNQQTHLDLEVTTADNIQEFPTLSKFSCLVQHWECKSSTWIDSVYLQGRKHPRCSSCLQEKWPSHLHQTPQSQRMIPQDTLSLCPWEDSKSLEHHKSMETCSRHIPTCSHNQASQKHCWTQRVY